MKTRVCNKCKESKPLEEFYKNKNFPLGRNYSCKPCHKAFDRAYRKNNPEKRKETVRNWDQANKPKRNASAASRRSQKLKATPAWANKEAIDYVYYTAKLLEDVYGTKWHVDHIVPLKGKNVCGLHTHTNLQLLTPKQNLEKSNTF